MCCNFLRNHRKLTLVTGSLLVISGILLVSLSSTMIKAIVKSKLVLKPDSYTYDFWKSIPLPIYYSIYMFNVTNANEVVTTGANPFLQEVGPFVYRVQQDKENIAFNSNGTVSYEQKKTYDFVAEKSTNVSLSAEITHLNIVLVAAATIIHNQYDDNDFLFNAIETACNDTRVDCSLFVQHNISDLLFEGYDDILIEQSAGMFPIPYKKFGFFVNRNDTSGADGVFNMFTGESDINKLGYLDKWNHSDHLGFYESDSKCDRFDYSSAGDFRPPYLLDDDSGPIYMFIGDVARSFRMDYHQDLEMKDISCKRYAADQHLFNYEIDENKCFCMNKSGQVECPDNGAANVSASTFGAPVFVSFPHFLYANKTYTEHLDGLNPVESKHGFYFDIEPTLAIPMRADAKMQINIRVKRNEKFTRLQNFPFKELVLPQLWTGISIEIDDDMTGKLKLVLKILPLICYILSSVLLLSGILLLFSVVYYKYISKKKNSYDTK